MASAVIPNQEAQGVALNEPPPSYETATAAQPPAEPPPSYQSIFGDLQRVRKESNGFIDFFKNLGIFLFSTIGFFICLGLFLAIPVTSVFFGVNYINDCPIQPKIPLYLIVLGIFCIFRNLICIYDKGKKKFANDEAENEEAANEDAKKTKFGGLIDLFLFAWFICGNVWVYGNNVPNFSDENSKDYCHKTVFQFAFWLNTSVFILIGTFCCCFVTVGCCIAVFSESEE